MTEERPELKDRVQSITAAPPDLWAVFSAHEKREDGVMHPTAEVERVVRVAALAQLDPIPGEEEIPVAGITVGPLLGFAEEIFGHSGYVFAADEDEARQRGAELTAEWAEWMGEGDETPPQPRLRTLH
jgi:hypothetical protein